MTQTRIFSGVQPTGDLHLGNYLGAIKQFVRLQDQGQAFYCVVDLHAITMKYDTTKLRNHTLEIAAAYLASGVNPDEANIFVQSHVPAHSELAWLLNCVARMGWLERMTQFREKAGSTGENSERVSVGLFDYPVLMAADILAYRATHVPVGEDQMQHINLCRDIAEKLNKETKRRVFPIPEAVKSSNGMRIKSLFDGSIKMSKSDPNPNSRINLMDDENTVRRKIKKATASTELFPSFERYGNGEPNASVVNLIDIYMALCRETVEAVFGRFEGKGWGVFKPALADVILAEIGPISAEMRRLLDDNLGLCSILERGAENANAIASQTVKEVRDAMGFLPSFGKLRMS